MLIKSQGNMQKHKRCIKWQNNCCQKVPPPDNIQTLKIKMIICILLFFHNKCSM